MLTLAHCFVVVAYPNEFVQQVRENLMQFRDAIVETVKIKDAKLDGPLSFDLLANLCQLYVSFPQWFLRGFELLVVLELIKIITYITENPSEK